MGKTVIVIDLNPLSRSSRRGSITIVDELSRCLENMLAMNVSDSPSTGAYDHRQTLQDALDSIVEGMTSAFSERED
jgi:4-phosphopantoate--beta-alanine ligase